MQVSIWRTFLCRLPGMEFIQVVFWIMQVAFWIGNSSCRLPCGGEQLNTCNVLHRNFFIQVEFWRRTFSCRLRSALEFLHADCLFRGSLHACWIGISSCRLPCGGEQLHTCIVLDRNFFIQVEFSWRRTSSCRLPSGSEFLGCLMDRNFFRQIAF